MSTYPFITETLDVGNETLVLRGLSLPHILKLVSTHETAIGNIFVKATTGQLEATSAAIAMELADDFPSVCGMIIAFGAGKPIEDASIYGGNLPVGFQLEALEIVGRLTMASAGGAEKFWEIINSALQTILQRVKFQVA